MSKAEAGLIDEFGVDEGWLEVGVMVLGENTLGDVVYDMLRSLWAVFRVLKLVEMGLSSVWCSLYGGNSHTGSSAW